MIVGGVVVKVVIGIMVVIVIREGSVIIGRIG